MPATVDVLVDTAAWEELGLEALAQEAADAALATLGGDPGDFELSVLGCDDARIAALNAAFRDRETPTNVLSWPAEERRPPRPGLRPDLPGPAPVWLGDIAIADGVCRRESSELGVGLADHTRHLIAHAVLHLLGYDHETHADAEVMESLERDILARMGLPDPYC
jgi:probable rRNA maturation factor